MTEQNRGEELYEAATVDPSAELEGRPTFVRIHAIPKPLEGWELFLGYNAMDDETAPRKRFYIHTFHTELVPDEVEVKYTLSSEGKAELEPQDDLKKALGDEDYAVYMALIQHSLESYATMLFLHGEIT